MQLESGQIVYVWSNFQHLIRFHFSKGMDHIVQNQPRSDQHGLVRVWPNKCIWSGSKLVCRNHCGWFLAKHSWPATGFPLSGLVMFFHKRPRSCCAKPSWIRFSSGWLCQILAAGKQVCKNHFTHFWPTLLSQSESEADQIWNVYWVSLCLFSLSLWLSLLFSVYLPCPSLPVFFFLSFFSQGGVTVLFSSNEVLEPVCVVWCCKGGLKFNTTFDWLVNVCRMKGAENTILREYVLPDFSQIKRGYVRQKDDTTERGGEEQVTFD